MQAALFRIGLAHKKAIMDWSAFDGEMAEDLAKTVREYHIRDFSKRKDHDSFEAAFARLLRDLKAEESTGSGAREAGPHETPH
jgi:hypothetical protein